MIVLNYSGLTGRVVVPGDAEYEQARQEWNIAIDKYPCAIVYCYDTCDVANAILWSRRQRVELRIRSGGHNYAGFSVGNHVLVIDTTFMNGIRVNSCEDTVTVQAGTRLLDLYETLSRHGYAFPGGTCPTVAISGLVLGGGIGLSSRYLGLTADSLLEAEMVDADGQVLVANECDNADLFWALRGAGGGNYGVVTSYKFRLYRVAKITLVQLEWYNNKPVRLEFLDRWQHWLEKLDSRMSAFGGIYKVGAWFNAFFYGSPQEAEQLLAPFLTMPGITTQRIEYVDFLEAVRAVGRGEIEREAFQSSSRFVQGQLTGGELLNLIKIIDKAPTDASSYLSVYSMGGAIRMADETSTAFFFREADYILGISSTWDNPAQAPAHRKWVAAGLRYIYGITVGSYINFPYAGLPDYERAYYGEYVGRLRRIKQEYDPDNVFVFPQSIKPISD